MLTVKGLVKVYKKIRAVNAIDFQALPGQVIGILGPNGAGKSTTIKCICGLIRPTEGQITFNGLAHCHQDVKSMMAYVPEVPEVYDLLTVWEHYQFIGRAYRLHGWEPRTRAYAQRYELTDKGDTLGQELSKGMKQKLSLIMALMIEPKIILLDEPMIGLDPMAIRETKSIMRELADAGCTVVVSTHLLDTIETLCDNVLVMKNGKIIAQGSPEDLKASLGDSDATLEEVFLEVTKDV